jgi:hypothetical protein
MVNILYLTLLALQLKQMNLLNKSQISANKVLRMIIIISLFL